jgi:hypothetical protein
MATGSRLQGVVEVCRDVFTADVTVDSREEFHWLVDDVTIRSQLPDRATPLRVSLAGPLGIFLIGVVCALLVGSVRTFLTSHAMYIFTLDLAVALGAILWLEQAGPAAVTDIERAFESPPAYYGLVGSMLSRMYQPFPHTAYGTRRENTALSVFFAGSIVAGVLAFAIVPGLVAPERFGAALGMDWGSLHPVLQAYVVLLVGIASLVGVTVTWVIAVGAWHMGVEARDLQIALDITRARNNLGLIPYVKTVLLAAGAYFLVYLITTSAFLVIEINRFTVFGLAVMTVLPLLGFVGSQYGLHVAICRSKQRRLQRLSEEFNEEIRHWFRNDGPAPPTTSDAGLDEFVAAKQSIESLPNWPVGLRSAVQLAAGAIASNVWIIQELAVYLD